MRLVGYIRVSSVGGREGESFISPDVQREQIEGYAKLHRHEVVEWFRDLDEPGSKYERPNFQRALAYVERGLADGLAVAKLDRFARSSNVAYNALKRLEDAGAHFIAVGDSVDSSTPAGRLARDILFRFAQYELERITENWDVARQRAVARGIHIASRVPTGYRTRSETDKRLVPDAHAAPVIAELYRRRADGAGWTELARFLEAQRVVGPYGNKKWTHGAVQKLIRNRTYLGEARSGNYMNPDAHPPLVSEALWVAANRKKAPATPAHKKRPSQLLTGLVRCAGCRYVMKADRMTDRNGESLGMYRCRARHAAGMCPEPANVLARVIEPCIERQVLSALGPDGVLAEAEAFAAIAEAQEAQRRLDEARAELEAFLEVNDSLMRAAPDIYERKLGEKTQAVETAEREVAASEQLSGLPPLVADGTLSIRWDELSADERRQLLGALIDCVVIRRGREPISERVTIIWRGQAPNDVPRRGHRVPIRAFAPRELRVTAAENGNEDAVELLTSNTR
jgi:site-specific DNA recombinase